MYGALGGLGKGLEQEYLLEDADKKAEAKDSRTYQLERLRQKSAMERQNVSDKSAQQRQTEKLASDKEALTTRMTQQESSQASEQVHEIAIEEMRQKAAIAKEQRKSTTQEMEDRFSFSTTKPSTTVDPVSGAWKSTEASSRVTDEFTGTTYLQTPMDKSVKGGNVMFVPEGGYPPTPGLQQAGQKAIKSLLLNAPKGKEDERMFQFLRVFRYLPPEFFNQMKRASRAGKLTEATTIKETLTQPATQ